jgi:precorrin-3B synthase
MTPRLRRDACPTIAVPIETGDGLLARLPPAGPLKAAALLTVADAARRFGNGIVEVTARGSIQVRGLTATSTEGFVAALAEAGVADARPAILAGPLAGHDSNETADVRPLVRALRDAVVAVGLGARLAPKASVVIDGGGPLHLDAIDADLRLVATDGGYFHVGIGGDAATARPVGLIDAGGALPAALAVLRMIAALGPAARGRDLDPAGVVSAIGARRGDATPARRPQAEPVGVHRLRDGAVAVGVGLPFGQTDAATLAALVEAARDCGATALAPAERRTLIGTGIAPAQAATYQDRAARLGFIVAAGDPRRSVIACPGAPVCASGRMPARAVAADIAAAAVAILDGSVTLHISGCAKGCANPRTATLTLVGGEKGAGLVVEGRSGDPPLADIPSGDLGEATARVAAMVADARRRDETAAAAIARLGADRIASTFSREPANA